MRYAIYFTPAKDDPLTQSAAEWLARDAFDGGEREAPAVDGVPQDEWRTITADPRRYGFHATLKAPILLADDRSEADFVSALDAFAGKTAAFDIPELAIAGLGPFFALVPRTPNPVLQEFAGNIVEHFDVFRAPLSAEDIARRKPENLTDIQRTYLEKFGYPYVMEEFQFHMTLTGRVATERRDATHAALERRFSPFVGKPRTIDALTIFIEPERGAPFTLLHRAPLKAELDQKVSA